MLSNLKFSLPPDIQVGKDIWKELGSNPGPLVPQITSLTTSKLLHHDRNQSKIKSCIDFLCSEIECLFSISGFSILQYLTEAAKTEILFPPDVRSLKSLPTGRFETSRC